LKYGFNFLTGRPLQELSKASPKTGISMVTALGLEQYFNIMIFFACLQETGLVKYK
jgi:hypothetical protein